MIRFRVPKVNPILAGSLILLPGAWLYAISARHSAPPPAPAFEARRTLDTSGYATVLHSLPTWNERTSLAGLARIWDKAGYRLVALADKELQTPDISPDDRVVNHLLKACALLFEGEPARAYEILAEARPLLDGQSPTALKYRYTLIYLQGVAALRLGETENCVDCRGASACILPLSKAAIHRRPEGSRNAIRHFSEYLERFPDDLAVAWLLNIAYMTLGEYPDKVPERHRLPLDRLTDPRHEIGRFRDVAHLVGLERTNEAGGAIMDDFDNDGLLDIVVTSSDPRQPMGYFRNLGNGRFKDKTESAGLTGELGGLTCFQGDYDNDGYLDIYVPRGAWFDHPVRPSLLHNNGDGTFTNVTEQAGLLDALNSNSARWADYDNDGFIDLFVSNETGSNHLYHNQRNGRFVDVTERAGLKSKGESFCKGATWIDYNGDDYPDLFVNNFRGSGQLFRNERNGTFSDVTFEAGIDGPRGGFSCWAFDYNNDGLEDIFATCYLRTPSKVVLGFLGQPNTDEASRLFRNVGGNGFRNVAAEVGLDQPYATMGSNFGDFDNDGFLDLYLGTGEPNLATLVPNRMFRNLEGKRFAEITGGSGTGHLQKGHGIACGDWDRDGNIDLFAQMGGTVPGDRYHNLLFQNPGSANRWVTVSLRGKKTNRFGVGGRIKVVTTGPEPRTFYRWVNSGSSFGGNPLQQTIGLGKAEGIARLEVRWPTSRTTQVFRDLEVNQALEVTEFAARPRVLPWRRLPAPPPEPGAGP